MECLGRGALAIWTMTSRPLLGIFTSPALPCSFPLWLHWCFPFPVHCFTDLLLPDDPELLGMPVGSSV